MKESTMDDYGIVTAPGTLRFERILPGPIERVWSYLTDSEKRARWLASGEMELRIGGRIEHIFRNSELTQHDDPPPPKYAKHGVESRLHGRITACQPPRLLAYTWGEGLGEASEVRFELSAHGEDVRLIVIHSRLATGDHDDMISVAGGWHAHLGILADRLNGRTPAGFWATHTRLEAEYEQRIPVESGA
jgi:uncharacterized protein YndB with AHSA1/START domain